MQYTSLASLLISIFSTFLGQFIFNKNPKSTLNRLYFVFCILLAYGTFCEFMYRQTLDHDIAFVWIKMASEWPFVFPLLAHLSLVFTDNRKFLNNAFTYVGLYFPALIVFFLVAFTDLVVRDSVMGVSGWTYLFAASPATLAVLIWVLVLGALFFFINIRFYLESRDRIKKKQVLIISLGSVLTIVLTIAYKLTGDFFRLKLPEAGSVAVLTMMMSIGYAIWKYKMFYLDIQTSSDTIIRTLADAMLLVNNEGEVVKANPAASKMLLYRENLLEGMKLKDILGDQELYKKLKTRQMAKEGVLNYIETYFSRKDGEYVPVGLSVSTVKDEFGRDQGMVYMFRDLTERRKIEEELWKYRNRLEKMVESRTIELTKVNSKLVAEIDRCKVLEENLRESQEQYRGLVEEQREAVTRWKLDSTLTFVNSSCCKMLKMEKEELLGKKWILIIPKAFRRQIQQDLDELQEKPEEFQYQTPALDSKGQMLWLDWLAKPICDESGAVVEYQSTGRDITAQKNVEKELEKAQGRIKAIYESANQIAFVITDLEMPNPRITEFSPGAEKIFDYDRDEVIGKPLGILSNSADARRFPEFYKKIRNSSAGLSAFVTMIRNGNEPFHAFHTAYPLLDTEGEVYSVLITIVDMSELKKMQDEVASYQSQQRAILDNLPDIAWLKDKNSNFIAVNEAFGKSFGVKPSEMSGKNDYDIADKPMAEHYREDDREVMRTGKKKVIEEPLVIKGGKTIIIETIKTPFRNDKGEIVGTAGIARDITLRKKADEIVRKALAEKETLLQEIHHRLKNNLQVISGILYLESRKVNDKNVEEIIRHSISRLDTMAMIHSQLYEYNRHGEVDMDSFLKRLSGYLMQIYQSPGKAINIDCEAPGVSLSINQAMPLGLMVNEMITNSIVHGFRDRVKGSITVRMTEKNFRVRFLYEDNGPGMKEKVDVSTAQSMGFQLIYNLSSQLSAILKVTSRNAMKYDMEFENIISAAREG